MEIRPDLEAEEDYYGKLGHGAVFECEQITYLKIWNTDDGCYQEIRLDEFTIESCFSSSKVVNVICRNPNIIIQTQSEED